MKKSILCLISVLFLFLFKPAFAQWPNLLGMNESGGLADSVSIPAGSIYMVNFGNAPSTTNPRQMHCFKNTSPGGGPAATPLQGSDGKIYGSTANGGLFGSGVLFRFDPETGNYAVLHHFGAGSEGSAPYGTLVEAGGKLFGVAAGGSGAGGVLYSYNLATGSYSEPVQFGSGSAAAVNTPGGGLCAGTDNKLYGFTCLGGDSSQGALFRFDPQSQNFQIMKHFAGGNQSAKPVGSLLLASNGLMYGASASGGNYGVGTLFSYNAQSDQLSKVHDFDTVGGAFYLDFDFVQLRNLASYRLTQSADSLYGVSNIGGGNGLGGVIFRYSLNNGSFRVMHNFDPGNYIPLPGSNLTLAQDGNFYGLCSNSGSFDGGFAWRFNPANGQFSNLLNFDDVWLLGRLPYGGFLKAINGKLYCLTSDAGPLPFGQSLGLILHYDISSGQFEKDIIFNDAKDGRNPKGRLTMGSDGKLYGVADGGSHGNGLIFSIDSAGTQFTKLYEFPNRLSGINPQPTLLAASDGKLYGTAMGGSGFHGAGVLFRYDIATQTYQKLFDFNGASQGFGPKGDLLESEPGIIMGTTWAGGNDAITDSFPSQDMVYNGTGVLYRYTIATGTYQRLHKFDGELGGKKPNGGLVKGRDGLIFGTTQYGGKFSATSGATRGGLLYSFNPANGKFSRLHDFNSNGANLPQFSLTLTNDGRIAGTSKTNGSKTFFIWNPKEQRMEEPFPVTPKVPTGGCVQASNGMLYLTTQELFSFSTELAGFNLNNHSAVSFPGFDTKGGVADMFNLTSSELFEYPRKTDIGIQSVGLTGNSNTVCSNAIDGPLVTIKNWGKTPVSSVNLVYWVNPGLVYNHQASFTGGLQAGKSVNLTLPGMMVEAGTNNLTMYCQQIAGDAVQVNDTASFTFRALPVPSAQGSLAESFSGTFPPAAWVLKDPSHPRTWTQTDTAFHSAPSSLLINNFDQWGEGLVDDLDLPEVNLSSLSAPKLSFWRAYSLYTNPAASPNFSDTLDLLISTDCGNSYQRIYRKYGTQLVTASPAFTADFFVPAASDWKKDSIDLSPFAQATNAMFRIRNTSQYENALYLDDISIYGATGLKPMLKAGQVRIFPNPSKGKFSIQLEKMHSSRLQIRIFDVLGNLVHEQKNEAGDSGAILDMADKPAGIYYLNLETDSGRWQEKLVLAP